MRHSPHDKEVALEQPEIAVFSPAPEPERPAAEEVVAGIARRCDRQKLTVATAESCTGGLLAAALTSVAGASSFFCGGIVCYSSPLKVAIGVPAELIGLHGAASLEVAAAMAQAVRTWAATDVGVAVTGAAGPLPDGNAQPGQIYIACADASRITSAELSRDLGREENRNAAVRQALALLCNSLPKG